MADKMNFLGIKTRFFLAAAMAAAFVPAGWSQSPIQIPLEIFPDPDGNQRIGIQLSLGHSGEYNLYLLDTGSQPLIVKDGVARGGTVFQGTSGSISYGSQSSDSVSFDTYQGAVRLKDTNNVEYFADVQFGVQTTSAGLPGGAAGGILGAGPAVDAFTNTNPGTSGSTPSFNLFSIIGQIAVDPSLMYGYSIRVDGANSVLTIGISQEFWNAIPIKLTMRAPSSPTAPYPNTGATTYESDQIASTVTFEGAGGAPIYVADDPARPVKIDSGAPTGYFVTDSTAEYQEIQTDGFLTSDEVVAGTSISLDAITGYDYLAGASGPTETKVYEFGTSGTYPHFNTGINPFNQYEIVFLLEGGYVGFIPIPEPNISFLTAAGALAFLWRGRRGQRR